MLKKGDILQIIPNNLPIQNFFILALNTFPCKYFYLNMGVLNVLVFNSKQIRESRGYWLGSFTRKDFV